MIPFWVGELLTGLVLVVSVLAGAYFALLGVDILREREVNGD